MSAIALQELTKIFADGTVAVDALTLDIEQGEFMVLVGPTGCGKSTILRLVAGLDEPTSGHVYLDGRLANRMLPRQRDVAMVFQDYALYPHLTVAENIAFPLRAAQLDDAAIQARVGEVAEILGIQSLLRRVPDQLSGGQRQRAAMARAVVRRPAAFLLDEPLSNLDAHLREDLRAEIVELSKRFGVTTLYVTHDRTEALTMADRMAVLRRGRLQQVGLPGEVYSDPANIFVAAFLGPGHTSLLQAALYAEAGGSVVIDLGTRLLRFPADDRRAAVLAPLHTTRLTLGVRADALSLVDAADDDGDPLRGEVVLVEDLGHEAVVHVETGAMRAALATTQLDLPDSDVDLAHLMAEEPAAGGGLRGALSRMMPRTHGWASGGRATPPAKPSGTGYGLSPRYDPADEVRPPRGDLVLRVPRDQMPRRGDTVALAVDLDRLYLFDRTGERIRLPDGPPRP
jgi:multiple sugar transport system ATP-binding protein